MTVPQTPADTKPNLAGAILLWSLQILADRDIWPGSVAEILNLTGAGRSQVYVILDRLKQAGNDLEGRPGRPQAPSAAPDVRGNVLETVRDFLMDNPGTVSGRGVRRTYSAGFRRFVVDLAVTGQPGATLSAEALADAVGVPLGTLKDWLRQPTSPAPDVPAPTPQGDPTDDQPLVAQPQIRTIIDEWSRWDGPFTAFCTFLQQQHRLHFGMTFIGNLLAALGLRNRKPRGRQGAPWSRGTFRTFFPGAQWLGDGTSIAIRLNERLFAFNVEAIQDVASNALVGVTVTDTEDEQAVIKAFQNGVLTAGDSPIALTLDNRPSNHTPAIAGAIEPAELLASTPARGQAKAPLEGAFGLFAQTAPPLVLAGDNWREIARSTVCLIFTLWAWTRNGKPRSCLGGRSPRDVYQQDHPTEDEIRQARAWILELRRRTERARLTREAQADPVRVELLAQGLAALGIPDPDGRLARSLARYAADAIARGLAAYRARQDADTLPPNVMPGRYLGGMIRNFDTRFELERTAAHLLDQRIRLHDLTLEPLLVQAQQDKEVTPPIGRPRAFIDRALATDRLVDFRFWTKTASAALADLPPEIARSLYTQLTRRVAASFRTDRDWRADLIDRLARTIAEVA